MSAAENERQAMLDRLTELRAALPVRGDVFIIPHDYPDPDALASAAALQLLLARHFGIHGHIIFTGMVTRAENREMLRHFHYRWRLAGEVRPPARPRPALFVDSAPWAGNTTIPPFVKPVAVFDHHAISRHARTQRLFMDVRPEMGASVSILHQYLRAAEVAVPPWLATVMTYAITTETTDFSRPFQTGDMEAYFALLPRSNLRIMGEIRSAPLPRSYYSQLREAIGNTRVYGRVAWSHLNTVHHPEIVPEIADLLGRMERVTWSFCTAFCEEALVISLRSSQKGARCGSLLKKIIRKDGTAGGHNRMAAGSINIAGLAKPEREARRDHLVRTLIGRLERRLVSSGEPLEITARPLADPGAAEEPESL